MESVAGGAIAILDQEPLNYGSTSSSQPYNSPQSCCSSISLYSYTTDMDPTTFIREAAGRRYNAWQNTLYMLPSDQPEFLRHDKQHRMLQLALGSLYPDPQVVETILTPQGNERISILDLGTGSGAWCIEMAQAFPHADVVGVDLVVNASRTTPPNCRFEFDDINLGLSHFHGQFNLVHSRMIVNGLANYVSFLDDVVACLKPGGIVIMVEGDIRPYHEDKVTHYAPADLEAEGGSWWARVCLEAFQIMKNRGSSIDGSDEVENGIQHPDIVVCRTGTVFVPLGPWATGTTPEQNASLAEQGTLMAENAQEFVNALSLLFAEAGYDHDMVRQWLQRVNNDLDNRGNKREYVKYRYAWGIKRDS
ncbi:hypothetical protein M408DRAFT_325809 [Serendipita vermifera MAFF 305830]|uniref:Methyltransferase domain-containing protein n=1 Tax=Serendipita vermifera MAFF 305830 TaxID=933852 RepID=A0A0C3BQM8_SERVB|nr:hypothetical protein M408DRAFT_325809 [Serendipita vermifera MAFF 305830]